MQKKLIKYGFDVPSPAYLVEHVREMEKRPFDGVMIELGNHLQSVGAGSSPASRSHSRQAPVFGRADDYGHVFLTKKFDEKVPATEMAALAKIEWDKFTDNFVMVYSGSTLAWASGGLPFTKLIRFCVALVAWRTTDS